MPTALITGAGGGLGRVFAERLARDGHDVVLVGRDRDRLERTAAAVRRDHGRTAEVLAADLALAAGCARVEARLAGGEFVDLLVNNAGIWFDTPFLTQGVEAEDRLLRLNAGAVLRLTHAALPRWLAAGGGQLLNVASVAALEPLWLSSTYPASKAWTVSFTRSLARSAQLRHGGVTATVVLPGYTRTRPRAQLPQEVPAWLWLEPERVVDEALRAVRRGRTVCIPGRRYRTAARLLRHLPALGHALLARDVSAGAAPQPVRSP